MLRLFVVVESVSGIISSAPYVPTDKADPKVGIRVTDATFIQPNLFSVARVFVGPLT